MRPNYLAGVLIVLVLVGVLGGTVYYFSHILGGKDDTVKKVVSAFVLEPPPPTWRDDQVAAYKVQLAMQQRGEALRRTFGALDVPYPPTMALLRVFKDEKTLELWAGPTPEGTMGLVGTYPLCTDPKPPFVAGTPAGARRDATGKRGEPDGAAGRASGRSRRAGAGKVPPIPEGFYTIVRYFTNDLSNFLALKLDCPNAVDKILMPRRRTRQEVFVRGGCGFDASIHLGTEGIMDVYLVTMEAHAAGQAHVPVHLFPTRMAPDAAERLEQAARNSRHRRALYRALKEGYARFEASHLPFVVAARPTGRYRFDVTPTPGPASVQR